MIQSGGAVARRPRVAPICSRSRSHRTRLAFSPSRAIARFGCSARSSRVALASPVSRRIVALCAARASRSGRGRRPSRRSLARARSDLGAVDGHHVTCVVETLERPHPSANGVSVRARIVDVAPAGCDPQPVCSIAWRCLTCRQMPPRARDLAGESAAHTGANRRPAGVRNEGEPAERDQLADQGVSVILTVHRPRDVAIAWDAPADGARGGRGRAADSQTRSSRGFRRCRRRCSKACSGATAAICPRRCAKNSPTPERCTSSPRPACISASWRR